MSIGVCQWVDGMPFDEVLDNADRAMYADKVQRVASILPAD